jgi:hypothetical protein
MYFARIHQCPTVTAYRGVGLRRQQRLRQRVQERGQRLADGVRRAGGEVRAVVQRAADGGHLSHEYIVVDGENALPDPGKTIMLPRTSAGLALELKRSFSFSALPVHSASISRHSSFGILSLLPSVVPTSDAAVKMWNVGRSNIATTDTVPRISRREGEAHTT